MTAAHARALIAATWWPQIRAFSLTSKATPGAQTLLGQNWPSDLERLEVQCGEDSILRLVPANKELAKLRVLRIPNCSLTDATVGHLTAASRMPRLLELDLSG